MVNCQFRSHWARTVKAHSSMRTSTSFMIRRYSFTPSANILTMIPYRSRILISSLTYIRNINCPVVNYCLITWWQSRRHVHESMQNIPTKITLVLCEQLARTPTLSIRLRMTTVQQCASAACSLSINMNIQTRIICIVVPLHVTVREKIMLVPCLPWYECAKYYANRLAIAKIIAIIKGTYLFMTHCRIVSLHFRRWFCASIFIHSFFLICYVIGLH